MSISREVLEKYHKYSDVFVETGTYLGQTVELAEKIGFTQIHTIEVQVNLWGQACDKFDNENIFCWLGDSIKVLPIVLKNIKEPAVFWLDGHWSQGITGRGVKDVPLYEELELIKAHSINTHTILIDDIRLFGNTEDVVDWRDITLDKIKALLFSINPNYKISYEDGAFPGDILAAYME